MILLDYYRGKWRNEKAKKAENGGKGRKGRRPFCHLDRYGFAIIDEILTVPYGKLALGSFHLRYNRIGKAGTAMT